MNACEPRTCRDGVSEHDPAAATWYQAAPAPEWIDRPRQSAPLTLAISPSHSHLNRKSK